MCQGWKDAPAACEIRLAGNKVWTEWMCGIVYRAPGLENFPEEEVKKTFAAAISYYRSVAAITSYMNIMFDLDGEMEIVTNWDSGAYMKP